MPLGGTGRARLIFDDGTEFEIFVETMNYQAHREVYDTGYMGSCSAACMEAVMSSRRLDLELAARVSSVSHRAPHTSQEAIRKDPEAAVAEVAENIRRRRIDMS